MLWDTHMHCHFSGDSDTAPEDMIKASIEKGLNGICFTDHLDYDYKEHPGMFDLDVDSYYKEIISLRDKYKSVLPINFGIELGLQPHVVEKNNIIISINFFIDFILIHNFYNL